MRENSKVEKATHMTYAKSVKWFLYFNMGLYGSSMFSMATETSDFPRYFIVSLILLLTVAARHGIYEAQSGDKFWLTVFRSSLAVNLMALSYLFINGDHPTAYLITPLYVTNLAILIYNFHYHPNKKVKLAFRKKMLKNLLYQEIIVLILYPVIATLF